MLQYATTVMRSHYMSQGSVDVEDSNFQVVGGAWRTGDVDLLSLGTTVFQNQTQYAKAIQEILTDYFQTSGQCLGK